MATQNVNIGINVSDNGTAKKVVKSFEEITNAAQRAQRSASSINIPVKSSPAPASGTQGSRRASQPTGMQQQMDSQGYGQARGSMGATGASARDFANQAQGLGGLVRLYATLAANIFAASAAYNALSNAMDTTNLVKGLDMLGAQSGKSLGTLSKRLVEVTDGAVSMREAMTATAQASSAGMSGKNIERLAQVAKNASLALGVAMPDALSRLSRGIVKLEPELLDELGLFTKIGPATERYALEIGKAVGQLTDFERRQAFANAVLEEGEKKFGALSQAASNPYDKLLATLKNVLQSGGELINKVLGPIVGLLAESPSALAAVIAGLSVVLLKQALPAIGQLRAGLRNTAEEALNTAEAFKESFGDEFQTRLEQRFKLPSLEADVKKAESELAKLKFPGKMPASVTSLLDEKGELNQKKINSLLETRNKTIETGMRGTRKASEAQIEAAKQEVAYIQKAIDLYNKKQALETGREGAQAVADITPGRFDAETIAARKYQDLLSKVDRSNAISNAAQNAQIIGVRGSWALLNTEIAEKGITGFAKYSTLAQGGLAAIGTRVMGVVGSLGRVGEVVALAVAGFMLLDSWLSKNSKQAEAFTKGLTTSQEAMANVARTISAASDINGFGTATINNTVAFSTALNELSGSLSEIIKLSREADKAAGMWDKFWDGVFSVVGKDRASKLAKTVAGQIQSSLDLLKREGLAESYKAEVQKILQVDDLENVDKVSAAFKNLSKEQQNALTDIQNNANRLLGNAGSALQGFKDKTDEALKAQKTLSNSFLDTSPSFKYGESLVAVSSSLTALVAQGPKRVAQALEELSTNMEKAAMFGPEFVSEFGKISSEFGKQKSVIDGLNNALVTYQKQLSTANTAASTRGGTFTETPGAPSAMRGTSSVDLASGQGPRQQAYIANSNVREIQRAINNAPRDAVDKSLKLVEAAAKSLFDRGMAFIGKAVRDAQTTASITIGRALTSNLTGPQKLQAEAAFSQQELKARLADISISEQMMDTQGQLVNEMKLANALQAEANILQKNAGTTDEKLLLQNREASKQVQIAALGAQGVGAAGMLGSDLLSDKEKADIKQDQARQKRVQQAALRPAKILVESQLDASQIGLKSELPVLQAQQQEELKKISDKTNASLLARQDIMSSIASVTSAEVIKNRQNAELVEKSVQQNRELEAINVKIAQAEMLYAEALARKDKGAITAQATQLLQLNFLEQQKQLTEEAQLADTSLTTTKNKQPLLAQELAHLDKRYELLRSTSDLENQAASTRLDTQSQLLSLQGSANGYSQEYLITSQTALDKEKLLLDTNIAMQQAQDVLTQKREAAELRIAVLRAEGSEKNKDLINAETAELVRQETLTNNAIVGLSNQFNSKSVLLDKTKQINLEQERYNQILESSSQLATALGNAFGEVGNKLGSVVSSLTELAVSSEKSAKAMEDLVFDRDAENDPKKRKQLENEIALQSEKNAKNELALQAKIAGQAKNLFKEKTTAYKTLNGLEKLRSTQTVALSLKEFAIKSGLLKQEEFEQMAASAKSLALKASDALKSIGIDIPAIYAKFMALLGPFGPPVAAAAIAAFVGGAFGGGGGGTPQYTGPTSEQRVETQGTGMIWDAKGNKVETEGGIFGDSSAKANSIANSLEILRDNSFDSLTYDNKLLRSFERVADSITGTTNAIISSGIRNIPAALQGLLGSTSSVGKDLLSKVSGFLFGSSKSSTSVTSQRLELTGNFLAAANNITGSLKNVATTVTNWSTKGALGGLFGGNDSGSSVTDNILALPDDVRDAFEGILDNLTVGYEEIAKAIGKSSSEAATFVSERLRQVEFKDSQGKPLVFEFKDLKGEELATELNAFVSQINNISLKKLFPEFDKFKKYGEDFGTTVIKVVQGNRQVDAALRAMGSAFDVTKDKIENIVVDFGGWGGLGRFTLAWTKTTTAFELSETIINKMAGSLERFTDQAKFFIDNFLTEAERMSSTRADVNKALGELNLSTNLTRDEFKQLVRMQDLSTIAGRDMYQGLMDVQEGFFTVTQRITDLNKESQNLQIELLKAQGRTAEVETALDNLATDGMNQTELAAYNYNKSLQKQIDALKSSETATNQRISLEQKLLQLAGDTVALRAIELNKLDETNRRLQLQIWAVEDWTKVLNDAKTAIDKAAQAIVASENAIEAVRNRATDQYVAATEKVAAAQKSIADLAVEAAKRMQGFGKTLREFVKQQLLPQGRGQNAQQAFAQNTRLALTGDTAAIEKVPELAQAAIDAAKSNARSSEEFNSTRAAILAGVTNVAKFAEEQAALTKIPADEDPLVAANRALEDAVREQTSALSVANTLGASLIKTPEDLIQQYKKANQDLATVILEKALAEEAQRRAQLALDAIVGNTGNLIKAITGTTTETAALGMVLQTEFSTGFSALDTTLDGKLSYDELVKGLKGKATDDQIKDLIKATDLNADSLIDAYELELFNNTKSIVEALGSGFQMLDTNLDGKVSEAEFIKGMTGKASDAALKTIFDLVDGDNNKIINATELTAAQSVLTATNSADLSLIKDGVAGQIVATDIAATETSGAISNLNNENLLTITNNTATTVTAINTLLNNNIALFNAMNAVAANTKSLADSVTAGSGQAASGTVSGGNFLSKIGKTVGSLVSGVVGAVSGVISSIGSGLKKIFSDERTKTNISLHSRLSNGIGIYDYNYKEPYAGLYGSDRKRGVLAQEVKDSYPGAVSVARNGMYMVDYSKLPVPPEMLKFARGGVFSNQVVTRPTSFSLAQMGEAGPEAVMPLSRTRNGRLGVVSQTEPDTAFNTQIQNQNTALIDEVRKLREEVNLLRFEARATASATGKTTRILERVTQNGESLLVTDAATV